MVAIDRAVLMLSPVTIRTVMPARWHRWMASGTCGGGRGVSRGGAWGVTEVEWGFDEGVDEGVRGYDGGVDEGVRELELRFEGG